MELKQYHVVWVNLDPTMGSELRKTRPCLIISPDEMNRHLQTLIVAPMTTTSKPYPTRVKVKYQQQTGWVVIDQIRTIARERVIKVMGKISKAEIAQVKEVIRETLVA
ncbi:MAG: type II toxin-antitoxin system PemK/MazF family toxin [Bacteroidales bacterium]